VSWLNVAGLSEAEIAATSDYQVVDDFDFQYMTGGSHCPSEFVVLWTRPSSAGRMIVGN
jgi:hypothetical protein